MVIARKCVMPLLIALAMTGCQTPNGESNGTIASTEQVSKTKGDDDLPTPAKTFEVDINGDGQKDKLLITGTDPGPHKIWMKLGATMVFPFADIDPGEYISKVEPIRIGQEPGVLIRASTGNSALLTIFLWRDKRPLPVKWAETSGSLQGGLFTKGTVTFGPDNATVSVQSNLTGARQYGWDSATATFKQKLDGSSGESAGNVQLVFGSANSAEQALMRSVQTRLPAAVRIPGLDTLSATSGIMLGADQITGYAFEGDALSGLTLVLNVKQPTTRSLGLEQVAALSGQINFLVTTMHSVAFDAADRQSAYRISGFGLNWSGPGGHLLQYRRHSQAQLFLYSMAVDGRGVFTGEGRTSGGDPLDSNMVRVLQVFTSNQY